MAQEPVDPRVLADFRNFLFIVWQHLHLPAPTPVQYAIAHWLQHGPKRQIVMALRGVGKSWITSAFVIWCLLVDPEKKFLIVSASKQRSDDFSTFTQRLISEMPMLQHLMPTDDQRSSRIAFDVAPARAAHAPTVKSVGIFGQLTGSRATHVIADDVEVLNNSDTEDKRDKLLQTVMEFEAIINPTIGRITYLGTPQTESSMYNKLRGKGYEARIWPSRFPVQSKMSIYEGALAPDLVEQFEKNPSLAGTPTDPRRFNELDLMEREAAYGRSGFALQFMLDTSLSDAERYPLKMADLIVTECNSSKAPISIAWTSDIRNQYRDLPNVGFTGDRFYRPMFIDPVWGEYKGSVMTIDPSGRGKDETTYAVVKQLHGNLYLTACGGFLGGYEHPTLLALSNIAKEQKVNRIIIESNFGDGMFLKILQPVLTSVYPCTTEEVRHNIQKERRIIDTLEPVMNSHKLVVDSRVIKEDIESTSGTDIRYSLIYQLTHITRDRGSLKHDDRLDALAMAVSYWVEAVGQDDKKAIARHNAALLDADLKKFMRQVVGAKPARTGWVSTRAYK